MPVYSRKRIISKHQFGFHSKHATAEEIHRITNKITLAFERGKYCSAVFFDVSIMV
jgi:hypothetical protein